MEKCGRGESSPSQVPALCLTLCFYSSRAYYAHFTDVGTEAPANEATCSGTGSQSLQGTPHLPASSPCPPPTPPHPYSASLASTHPLPSPFLPQGLCSGCSWLERLGSDSAHGCVLLSSDVTSLPLPGSPPHCPMMGLTQRLAQCGLTLFVKGQ